MSEQESWQVSDDAAQIYEKFWVPAMLGQWAPQMANAAKIASGDRVLDVACGTGVVAREAANRVAAASQVTGLDLNESMLAVAQHIRPDIDWRQGDATKLPFDDESYDVVTCQFALMYFPDRLTALKEMMRVLKPAGRLAIAVWGPYERATGYVILTEIAERHCGQAAVDLLTDPFVLGNQDELGNFLNSAGINGAGIDLRAGTVTFSTIEQFIEMEVKGTPLRDLIDETGYEGLLNEAKEKLQNFFVDSGEIVIPMDAYIITAKKV